MEKNIYILKEKFRRIQPIYHINLRKGTTGVGYTFECLLNKKEDRNALPDYRGIEIKTHLGYSKYPISLFTLTPSSKESIKMLYEKYSYPNRNNRNLKSFKAQAYCNYNQIIANKYIFKLKVNYEQERLNLIIFNIAFEIIDETIYWNFSELKERLYQKLSYLAYVKAYPYNINGRIYFKYTNMYIYKLKNFESFLKLIEEDKISVLFNLDTIKEGDWAGNLKDHGTAFKLEKDSIDKLFDFIE